MDTQDPDLEESPELGPEVTSFLRGSAKNLEEEKVPSPEPPVKRALWMGGVESQNVWNTWLVQRVVSSTRGERLQRAGTEGVSLVPSSQKGKWGKQDGELLSGPPAWPCLLRKNFQLPPDSIFTCQDIQEMQREKTVAYAHALQYWAEKTDLPTGEKPHLLAASVKELQEEMRCYLSFSDKEVFEGVTSLEEDINQTSWEGQDPQHGHHTCQYP